MKKISHLAASLFLVLGLMGQAYASTAPAPKKPVDDFFSTVEAPAGTYEGHFTQIVGTRDGASFVLKDNHGKVVGFVIVSKKDFPEAYDIAMEALLHRHPIGLKVSTKHEISAIKLEVEKTKK